jgi:putative flippase GtrA
VIKKAIKKHSVPFLKYALVGVSGTVIDVGLFTLLIAKTPLGISYAGHIIAATISFTLAVLNNYTWNRKWTFRHHKAEDKKRFMKFFLVSCGGWVLNTTFLTVFSSILLLMLGFLTPGVSALAKICASGVVLIYNFIANRFWTFREPS